MGDPGRREVLGLLAGGGLFMAATGVAAHRARRSLTTVSWNERARTLEVIHRLHAHDAQQAVMRVLNLAHPDMSAVKPRAVLALYVEERFSLVGADGAPLALDLLGAELDGDHVLVFQERAMDAPPDTIRVRSTVLQDVFADQINDVKITVGTFERTVTLTADDAAKEPR